MEIVDVIGSRNAIVLINKSDLGMEIKRNDIIKMLPESKVIETSVINNDGVETVEKIIEEMVYSGDIRQEDSLMVTNVRHIELLKQAGCAIKDAEVMAEKEEAFEFIEVDIKEAYNTLGEITGETVGDDIINEVFSRFCLGK